MFFSAIFSFVHGTFHGLFTIFNGLVGLVVWGALLSPRLFSVDGFTDCLAGGGRGGYCEPWYSPSLKMCKCSPIA